MPVIGIVTILIFIGNFTQFDIVYSMATSTANPNYATDLFGSLFYRAAFLTQSKGGWGIGMGAAVSAVMSFVIFIGLSGWLLFFRSKKKIDY
jgi:raffinose/stachyose/melibiose transport system permease protein